LLFRDLHFNMPWQEQDIRISVDRLPVLLYARTINDSYALTGLLKRFYMIKPGLKLFHFTFITLLI